MSNTKYAIIQKIRDLQANIRWLEETDRFDRIDKLEDQLKLLKEELRSFEI